MHILGGMKEGGNIRRICKYLGIFDQIRLKDVDDDCTDKLYFAEDKTFYTIGKGREGFVASLSKSFPGETDNLYKYVDALFDLTDKVDLFNLRPSQGQLSLYSGSNDFLMSANAFIAKYTKNRKLQSVLAYKRPCEWLNSLLATFSM